jgi:hypothetical protein
VRAGRAVPACVIALLRAGSADMTALALALQSSLADADRDVVIMIAPTGGVQVAVHATCTLTLLVSDGADDTRQRAALDAAGIAYSVTLGSLQQQHDAARAAIARAQSRPDPATRWQWVCERCGDGGCERHLLPRA